MNAIAGFHVAYPGAIVIEHKKPKRRRKIAALPQPPWLLLFAWWPGPPLAVLLASKMLSPSRCLVPDGKAPAKRPGPPTSSGPRGHNPFEPRS